jgi:polyribonucleotide nucleotidyltransferase
MAEDFPDARGTIRNVLGSREKAAMRKQIIEKKIRADGRGRTTSGPSPAKSACCRARTAARCSRAARRRRWA